MYAKLNGTELFFERHGAGLPMLVMHGGMGLDHIYLRPWLDRLGDLVELIYYDHRGNGRSARPASMAGIGHGTWTGDADALRARLGFDRIVLFGHSYGGFLAQEYAIRFGDRLAGLILCSSAPDISHMPQIRANVASRGTSDQLAAVDEAFSRPMADDDDLKSVLMRFLPMYFNRYDPIVGEAMVEKIHFSATTWNYANAHCLPTYNTVERLKEITVPTLVLSGADDLIMPAEQSKRIHAELPNAELVLFKESGHFPFVEESERFVTTVGNWLAHLRQADDGSLFRHASGAFHGA